MIYDYKPVLNKLFEYYQPRYILEFGLGRGTKYLAKHCKKITSIELAVRDEHFKWYRKVNNYRLDNWKGHLFKTIDKYDQSIKRDIISILQKEYDLIFVDPGVHWRAEIVNWCFGYSPIIAAHDANEKIYGWEKVIKVANYHEVDVARVKLWIKDANLANKLSADLHI